jgi:hypothetical protein
LFEKKYGSKVSSYGTLNLTDFEEDIRSALSERRLFNINGTNEKFQRDIKAGVYYKIH